VPGVTVRKHTPERLYCVRELKAMSLADWQDIPVVQMPADELIPTQGVLLIDRLVELTQGGSRRGAYDGDAPDVCGHTVLFNGRWYIHDGHHDWGIRWLRGETHVPVRIKRIDAACSDPCCKKGGGG
jgi:hypothetical protein